jgi:hypothetical protein
VAATNTNEASRSDRKPDRHDNDRHDDGAPNQGRNLFRTSASRRVVGGVVEFLTRLRTFRAKPSMLQDCGFLD